MAIVNFRLMYITFALSLLWRQWRERNTVNDPEKRQNVSVSKPPQEEQVGHAREEESTGSFETDVLGAEKKKEEKKTEDTDPQEKSWNDYLTEFFNSPFGPICILVGVTATMLREKADDQVPSPGSKPTGKPAAAGKKEKSK
mmetsp:Transcript_25454/g.49880  ORF Transcript_25454/g.49880 Transcript_25454/m.49880 type:complete len:142 (+) Transcript_25454:69-494(+)